MNAQGAMEHGMDEASKVRLVAYLKPLDVIRAGFCEEIFGYIQNGQSPALLKEIAELKGDPGLGLCRQDSANPARDAFFSGANLGPQAWMRLANVLCTLFDASALKWMEPQDWRGSRCSDVAGALGILLRESALNRGAKTSDFYTLRTFESIVQAILGTENHGDLYNWFRYDIGEIVHELALYRDFPEFWEQHFPYLWRHHLNSVHYPDLEEFLPPPYELQQAQKTQVLKAAHDVVKLRLEDKSPLHLAWTLQSMHNYRLDLSPYAPQIFDWAMQADPWVSATARRVLDQMPEQALAHLAPILGTGSPKQRARAALVLCALNCHAAFEALQTRLEKEKAKSVRWTLDYIANYRRLESTTEVAQALLEHAKQRGLVAGAALAQSLGERLRRCLVQELGGGKRGETYAEAVLEGIVSDELVYAGRYAVPRLHHATFAQEFEEILGDEQLELVHLASVVALSSEGMRMKGDGWNRTYPNCLDPLILSYAKKKERVCALDLLAAFVLIGAEPEAIVDAFLSDLGRPDWAAIDRSNFNRFLGENLHLLVPRLGLHPADLDLVDRDPKDRIAAYAYLSHLDPLPQPLTSMILARSWNAPDELFGVMQASLQRVPDLAHKLFFYLESGSAKRKLRAASWIESLGDPSTIPALQARLGKEKNVQVRSAIIQALESMEDQREAQREVLANSI